MTWVLYLLSLSLFLSLPLIFSRTTYFHFSFSPLILFRKTLDFLILFSCLWNTLPSLPLSLSHFLPFLSPLSPTTPFFLFSLSFCISLRLSSLKNFSLFLCFLSLSFFLFFPSVSHENYFSVLSILVFSKLDALTHVLQVYIAGPCLPTTTTFDSYWLRFH